MDVGGVHNDHMLTGDEGDEDDEDGDNQRDHHHQSSQ